MLEIGKELIYLAHIRPDLAYAISVVIQFMHVFYSILKSHLEKDYFSWGMEIYLWKLKLMWIMQVQLLTEGQHLDTISFVVEIK